MSKKCKPEQMTDILTEYLLELKGDIEEDVVDISNKVIKEAKVELKSISPKANKTVKLKGGTTVAPGSYAKSWSIKNGQKAKDIYSKIAYNREHYRLTHLLEFGHATRNGRKDKSNTSYQTNRKKIWCKVCGFTRKKNKKGELE